MTDALWPLSVNHIFLFDKRVFHNTKSSTTLNVSNLKTFFPQPLIFALNPEEMTLAMPEIAHTLHLQSMDFAMQSLHIAVLSQYIMCVHGGCKQRPGKQHTASSGIGRKRPPVRFSNIVQTHSRHEPGPDIRKRVTSNHVHLAV